MTLAAPHTDVSEEASKKKNSTTSQVSHMCDNRCPAYRFEREYDELSQIRKRWSNKKKKRKKK